MDSSMTVCPSCDYENIEGTDVCEQCQQPLTDEYLHAPDTAVERGAGIFVLVRTSNPGARVFQDLVADDSPVYHHVAQLVERLANTRFSAGFGRFESLHQHL